MTSNGYNKTIDKNKPTTVTENDQQMLIDNDHEQMMKESWSTTYDRDGCQRLVSDDNWRCWPDCFIQIREITIKHTKFYFSRSWF